MINRFLKAAGVAGFLLFAANAASAGQVVPGEEHCVVNVRSDDALNMRERPGTSAPILSRLRYGTCGIVVQRECRGDWCLVEDGHNRGWVHGHYIAMVSPAMYCVTGVAPGDRLNLRAFPSPRSRVLTRRGRRQCGIAFLPYSVGNWQKIRVDGWQGWVARRHLSGQ
ncbi:SH3 domain-containing protein [Chelativorans sp. AA-79]|uniref:SH3 domain-containing protein n=1 Tax=Chelativorans sp. AA-79 TaxID=3028735 RepID=UPI0023F6E209|nr:SH3 domain-containing protein [Chelativorans sp. AA-79]WEX11625.1 SH3 domain-containing protein [Chelativorans sp. AA-79]